MIFDFIRRYWLALILVLCVVINVFIYWPKKSEERGGPGMAGGPGRERMEQMIESLPADQQAEARAHMAKMDEFRESVANLPEDERREKMREFFDENPPPQIAGMPGGPGRPNQGDAPNDGPSVANGGEGADGPRTVSNDGNDRGPGGGGPGRGARVPPVEVRKQMDKQIAQAQREAREQGEE